ncbi:MAG: sel1 repeat family protein, partial [Pararhodobacter sp.]|nr:sel1 repeat family protein [Pararhodobacter sp.]
RAQTNLGVMYAEGLGVDLDYAEAVRWYRAAAEQGYARAQTNLGVMYAEGLGVTLDIVEAHMWLEIATENGATIAVDYRENVASGMTQDQISEAQRRSRACLASNYQNCD